MSRNEHSIRVFAATLLLTVLSSVQSARASALEDEWEKVLCPPPRELNLPYQFDYRTRDSTAPSPIGTSPQWNYRDNWTIHTGPAVQRLQNGEYSRQVIADLDFTFKRWPNHLQALTALVKYYTGKGQQYEFLPAECYLYRAAQFAPNDVDVKVVIGVYFQRRGRFDAAREALEQALAINPNSVEAHYNLGLIYVQLKDFKKAKEHADEAYAGGYPLPGLRKMLQQAGVL